jgi:hypothetical protein
MITSLRDHQWCLRVLENIRALNYFQRKSKIVKLIFRYLLEVRAFYHMQLEAEICSVRSVTWTVGRLTCQTGCGAQS